MTPMDLFKTALYALRTNKLRTGLSVLGVLIGVMAVIVLVSLGNGIQQATQKAFADLGTTTLYITPGSSGAGPGGGERASARPGAGRGGQLTYEDAVALANRTAAPAILRVAPEASAQVDAFVGQQRGKGRAIGTTPDYVKAKNLKLARGEFFNAEQLQSRASVAVLGSAVAKALFGGANPVGQSVRLQNSERATMVVRVIGVLEPKGGSAFGSEDDQLYVPLTALAQRLSNQRTSRGEQVVTQITIQAASEAQNEQASEQAKAILRKRHRVQEDDFTVMNLSETLNQARSMGSMFAIFLGGIAAIALTVGGIGIMNIMLVSVTERTREIGLRLAVGAEPRHIIIQFLSEAMMVSGGGGVLGIAIGLLLIWGISQISSGENSLPVAIQPESILLSFGVSAAVGLFFGLYPAWKASQLDPVQALRSE